MLGRLKNYFAYAFFLFQLPLVGLIASGLLPRELYVIWALVLVGYFLWESLERSFLFFVVSLPLFLAMPLAPALDTMNVWRVLVAIMFVKWAYEKVKAQKSVFVSRISYLVSRIKGSSVNTKYQIPNTRYQIRHRLLMGALGLLFILTVISILANDAWPVGIKRLLFFLNIFMLVPVVQHLMARDGFFERLAKVVTISLFFILFVGYLQLAFVFVVPIDEFVGWWANHVTKNYYGGRLQEYILFDNNWFTYVPGEIPTLRMFSIFHESHALGLYVILALPFLGYLFWQKTYSRSAKLLEVEPPTVSPAVTVRGFLFSKPFIFVFALPLLATVLTGTRGLWISVVGAVAFVGFLTFRHRETLKNHVHFLTAVLLLFLLLFPAGSLVGFLEQKAQARGSGGEDIGVAIRRLTSVFNLEETSNVGRLGIWKATLPAIREHPFLGVGLGNFGSIMGSGADLRFSAHNLYLHIAAELGLPALLAILVIFYMIFRKGLYLIYEIQNAGKRQRFPAPSEARGDATARSGGAEEGPTNDEGVWLVNPEGVNALATEERSEHEPIAEGERANTKYEILFLFSFAWLLTANVFDVTLLDQRVLMLFTISVGVLFGVEEEFARTKTGGVQADGLL